MALYLSSISEDTALGFLSLDSCYKSSTGVATKMPWYPLCYDKDQKKWTAKALLKSELHPQGSKFLEGKPRSHSGPVYTHTHITPPPPKRLYKFLSHGVTVLNSALDTKSTLHDASSPQTRGQSKVHEVCLRVWPCRGRAKTRMPFLPPQNMQTTLSFAVFAKALGLGGGTLAPHMSL